MSDKAKKNPRKWSKEEDNLMISMIKNNKTKWSVIASKLPGRNGKQCRERWHNQLDPNILKSAW